MLDRRSIVLAAIMPTVAAVIMVLVGGTIFAQQPAEGITGETISISAVTRAFTAMSGAVVACAVGCWWLLKKLISVVEHAKEREECLIAEAKAAEQRHAQEISDTIREVMPLTIKLTEFIPTQQKLTQAVMELAQALGRKQDGEARRS